MQSTTTMDHTATIGADAPGVKALQEEAFSLIMELSEEQLLIAIREALVKEGQ